MWAQESVDDVRSSWMWAQESVDDVRSFQMWKVDGEQNQGVVSWDRACREQSTVAVQGGGGGDGATGLDAVLTLEPLWQAGRRCGCPCRGGCFSETWYSAWGRWSSASW